MFYFYINLGGGTNLEYGISLSLTALISMCLSPYIGYLNDKLGVSKIVITGVIIVYISLTVPLWSKSVLVLTCSLLLMRIGSILVSTSLYTLVSKLVWKNNKSVIPYYRSIQSFSVILGSALGGRMVTVSLNANLIFAAMCAFLSIALYFRLFRNTELNNEVKHVEKYTQSEKSYYRNLKMVFGNRKFLFVCSLFFLLEMAYDNIIPELFMSF